MTWWKWALLALMGVLALFIVMYIVGARLPTAHSVTVSTHLDAPPDSVWALVSDIDGYPEWRPDVERVARLEDRDGRPAWREAMGTGSLTYAAEEWDPPRRLVARIVDEDLPFAGTWTYELEPEGDGTQLTITEDGEVYHPLFRFMSRFVFGHDSTIEAYLEAVRAALDRP